VSFPDNFANPPETDKNCNTHDRKKVQHNNSVCKLKLLFLKKGKMKTAKILHVVISRYGYSITDKDCHPTW
jgi:hypothetical protein